MSFVVERNKEVQEWREQESLMRFQDSPEVSCQEEAQRKKAEKRKVKMRKAERGK